MKNILISGASGFIGLNMIKYLTQNNYKIFALVNKNNLESPKLIHSLDNTIQIYYDINDLIEDAKKIEPIHTVFNLAAVGINPAYANIEKLCDVNIKLCCQLADFVKLNKSRLYVHFGSCFEYGDHGNKFLEENMICHPKSLYSITKFAATNLLLAYSKQISIDTIIVRPFGVFGEGESLMRLAPSIINNCLMNKEISTTAGDQIRDFLNVKDLIKCVVKLSESNYESYNIYNICSNNPVTVKDFINEIIVTCKLNPQLVNIGAIPYRSNEAMICKGNNHKIQKIIDYSFPCNHKDGIMDIYNTLCIK